MSSRCSIKLFIVSFLFTFPLIVNPGDQQPAFEKIQPVSDWQRIQEFFLENCAGYIKAKE